ncbi:MAG: efflux RND transporter periplasmic adaptor subunit [Alphaproteobacteria bacterium]|nr:efflux RND transporter periplasmic adaptor subunit [Alphaproteobacteria bacterium]
MGIRAWHLVVLGLVGCAGDRAPKGYATAEAAVGALRMEVTAVGALQPMESVDIGSDLTGQVSEVLVDTNQQVTAGAVLARIDPKPFEIAVMEAKGAVASARAAIAQAEANLAKAQEDLDRTERLYAAGVSTEADRSSARTQAQVAAASLASARAAMTQALGTQERAREALDDTVITSPIDGVVLQRQVDPGQTVVSAMTATTLFVVASDLSRMKAEVDIDEADVARVQPGQRAMFTVSAWPERRFEAEVAQVDLSPDPTSAVVVYVAELHLDNPEGALRPGMTVTATIETGRLDDVVLVPAAALRFTPDDAASAEGARVWTLEAERPVAHPVELLGTDGMMSAVEGVEAGTAVITGRGG